MLTLEASIHTPFDELNLWLEPTVRCGHASLCSRKSQIHAPGHAQSLSRTDIKAAPRILAQASSLRHRVHFQSIRPRAAVCEISTGSCDVLSCLSHFQRRRVSGQEGRGRRFGHCCAHRHQPVRSGIGGSPIRHPPGRVPGRRLTFNIEPASRRPPIPVAYLIPWLVLGKIM